MQQLLRVIQPISAVRYNRLVKVIFCSWQGNTYRKFPPAADKPLKSIYVVAAVPVETSLLRNCKLSTTETSHMTLFLSCCCILTCSQPLWCLSADLTLDRGGEQQQPANASHLSEPFLSPWPNVASLVAQQRFLVRETLPLALTAKTPSWELWVF